MNRRERKSVHAVLNESMTSGEKTVTNENKRSARWMGDGPQAVKEGRLGIFVRKLLSHSRISTADQAALAALPFSLRTLEPNDYILNEGERAKICPVLLSGFAYRQKISADGGRQIVALKIPGDPLDFQSLYLERADHNLQALTHVELAIFSLDDLEALVAPRPSLARLAHLLCELYYRVSQIAGETLDGFELPLTQEQLADLLGLTPVHVNRTIKILEDKGAVKRVSRRLTIGNVDTLRQIAEFSDTYLHRNNDPKG